MQLNIWRFLDGIRAHEKQSAALIGGLRGCLGTGCITSHNINCGDLKPWKLGNLNAQLGHLPKPHFLVSAGHHSHWPMLLARRKFGGRSVVINRPSLPICWFDFAIIPEHDRPPALANVILIQGALCDSLPQGAVSPGRGLLLLGGPSKHFKWDKLSIAASGRKLLGAPLQWVVSDSRRTPSDALDTLSDGRAEVHHWQDCPPQWLTEQMAQAQQIWVTCDSISMVFEALQSQARVGILSLPSRRRANKVRGAMQRLVDQGLVSNQVMDVYQPVETLGIPLNQQFQCARALLRRCGSELQTVNELR